MAVLYPVTETFVSINGEGRKAGALSCFIRFAGCNLNCNYCDTRWSCDPGAEALRLTAKELALKVRETGIRCVTLTGGEPLLQPEMDSLFREIIMTAGAEIEVETNGSVPLREEWFMPGVFFTMDLKCPGSGMADRNCMENLRKLRDLDVVKYVVSGREDLDWMLETAEEYQIPERCTVLVSPVFGRIDPAEIVEYLKEKKVNGIRLQLQLHKVIWDPMARGV